MTPLKKMCTILTVLILTTLTNGAPIDPNESDANEEIFVWPTEFDPITEIDLKSYQALPEILIDPPSVMIDEPENTNERIKRKAVRNTTYYWPGAEVPYEIDSVFNVTEKKLINDAIDQWRKETCIKFTLASTGDRVKFERKHRMCQSGLGREPDGKSQPLNLGKGCMRHGKIIHEIGHAVGFLHEQSRPDRDNYVIIHNENIPKKYQDNFIKYSTDFINTYNVPYDYLSDMHYGNKFFSMNKKLTIETIDNAFTDKIGNRKGLSYEDVHVANLMYNCAGKSGCTVPKCTKGFADKDCNCKCKNTRENPTRNC